jgi:voltage-dependent potassium channel beta subunit
MEYRRLGTAGIKVSQLSLGSWVTFGPQVDVDKAVELMRYAYDSGVNFFDNAEVYAGGKSEQIMGDAIRRLGWRRSSYLISTKLYFGLNGGANERGTLNRKYLLEGIDGSLKRLGLDHVDLLFCHRPDPETPLIETARTMHEIVSSGRAMYWGTSEWSAAEIASAWQIAQRFGWHPPQMEQPQYNLLHRHRVEREHSRLYNDCGLGLTTWSPLASGLLTGKYDRGVPDGSRATLPGYEWLKERMVRPDRIEQSKRFSALAAHYGVHPAELAIAWCTHKPMVSTVILGASSLQQLKENLGSLKVVKALSPELLESLEAVFPVTAEMS